MDACLPLIAATGFSQAKLRDSIAETQRLMDASDEMLKRHRRELDEDDAQG